MNIFASSQCPVESAVALDDKRLIKMILESAQILSTAVRIVDGDTYADRYGLYKKTHANHPCSVWVRENVNSYVWLGMHADALVAEYFRRFEKVHASRAIITSCNIHWGFGTFPIGDRFEDLKLPNCAKNSSLGLDFTHLPVHDAYKAYLNSRWDTDKRSPTWTKSEAPTWRKPTCLLSSLESPSALQANGPGITKESLDSNVIWTHPDGFDQRGRLPSSRADESDGRVAHGTTRSCCSTTRFRSEA